MTMLSVDVFPKTESSVEVVDANGEISVDVGPAIVQTVAVQDANGEYSVELSMTPMGPEGPQGTPGRMVDVVGKFGVSKTPADLPQSGLIPKDWDEAGSPAKSMQFLVGDGLIYLPADTTQQLYGHVFAYTGTEYASAWLDCGVIKGDKGDKGDTGSKGDKGDIGATGPGNVLSIGSVVSGSTASASITGTSPAQTLNLVLPKGDKGDTGAAGKDGVDGHSPAVDMAGDQIRIDGIVVGPHLTGPQGPQGEMGKSLTILGHYDTEAELKAAHPVGNPGDCYLVGQGFLYVWDGSAWANVGQLQGPKGDKGDTGATGPVGPANNLTIGNVTSGTTPSVTIRGTTPNQIIDFVLAKGDKGDQGIQGIQGVKGDTGSQGPKGDTGSQGPQGLPGDKGDKGDPGGVGPKGDPGSQGPKGDTGSAGPANTLAIGTVTGGATASATITGASPNQTLNLVLPKGADGAQGPKGDQGIQGPKGSDATVTSANITAALGYTPIGAASPALSGVPTAPTATKGTNTAQIATTAFVLANAAAGGVSSVNGKTGAVTINYADVGSPATNGTSATGTWPINVTGSAGSANSAASCSGNAATATKWQTARTLTLTGAVTGTATIDGSANVSIATTGGSGGAATSLALQYQKSLANATTGTFNGNSYANDTTSNLPVSPCGAAAWWNVITLGEPTRLTQIASQAYGTGAGIASQNATYVRSKHDASWSNWMLLGGYGALAAWVRFNGSGTIVGGCNVSSVTKHGTGDFSVNFQEAMRTTSYAIAGQADGDGLSVQSLIPTKSGAQANTVQMFCMGGSGGGNPAVKNDPNYATVAVFK